MRDLLLWLTRELVEHPDAVRVDAVERDRAVVPVAPESYVIDWAHRLSRGLYGLITRITCRLTMK
jgi:hypothetical protein